MEQHFQDIYQKVQYNNSLECFAANFDQDFTQKPIPQKYSTIIYFNILFMVNPIDLMKMWGK